MINFLFHKLKFTFVVVFLFLIASTSAHAATLTVNSTSTIDSDTISGYTDVTVDAAGADITITFDDAGGDLNGVDWLFEDSVGGGSVTFSGDLETDGDVTIDTTITHAQSDVIGVDIKTSGSLTISANGSIAVNAKGCQGTSSSSGRYHDLDSNSCSVSTGSGLDAGGGAGSKGGGGGANGGNGGNGATASNGWGGTAYSSGDVLDTSDPDGNVLTLGGGGGRMNNRAGGAGGGIIRLDANSFTLNGSLNANGSGQGYGAGGGAGGTIFIKAITYNVSDVSNITAIGANATFSGTDRGGAGGGGRIIIFYKDDSQSTIGNFDNTVNTAKGVNSSYASQNGYDGTINTIEMTAPNQTSISSPVTNTYNFSRNGTFTVGTYSSNGLPQTGATVKIYTDAAKSNLVSTCTVSSGTTIQVNATNCTGLTQLASFTKYYAVAYHTNSAGNGTDSTTINFTTLFAGTPLTKTWHFNEGTPADYYTYNSTYVEVTGSNAQLKDLGSSTYQPTSLFANTNPTRYKDITLSSDTDLTDFQVKLSITYDSDMQADFDDLRFADSDNNVLKHYIESYTASTSATVWVKVPTIDDVNGATIKMYYGDSSATDASDPDNVFMFYDTFDGDSLDTTKWNVVGSKHTVADGTISFASGSGSWGTSAIYSKSNFSRADGFISETKMKWNSDITGNSDPFFGPGFHQTDTTMLNSAVSTTNYYSWYFEGRTTGGSNSCSNNCSTHAYVNQASAKEAGLISKGTWYYYRLAPGTSSGATFSSSTDDSTYSSFYDSASSTDASMKLAFSYHRGSYSIDYTRIRKQGSASSSFGSENPYNNYPTIRIHPKLGNGVSIGTPYSISHSISGTGSVKYAMWVDANKDGDFSDVGDKECYHDGTEWTTVSSEGTDVNTIDEINAYIGALPNECGTGNYYPAAYLLSDGSQQISIDYITMNYGASQITVDLSCTDVTEGTNVTCTLTPSEAPEGDATVTIASSDGTGLAGSDYTSVSQTVTFSSGSSSAQNVTITVADDDLDEPNETFTVAISNPNAYATLGTSSDTVTITDNDATPTLAVADQNVTENGGTQTINVALTGKSQSTVTVNYTTTNLTATAGTDYTTTSGSLSWSSGQTGNKTISIPITDNLVDNTNKTFRVDLSSADNATISDANGTITITDNESTPAITVNDPTATEGSNVSFTISMSPASASDVTVDYTTANGTATAGSDYTTKSGTATISAGSTSTVIAVSTTNDSSAEGSETLLLNLSNPSNATISDSQGEGTIQDNDAPSISIADVTADENDGTVTVSVSLTGLSDSDTDVDYATAGSTATSGTDFTATSGTLTWTAGQTGNKSFTVTLADDSLDEDDETFVVNLSNAANGSISDSQATITITDNDATPTITLSTNSNSIAEGENATLTATTSAVSGRDITVNLGYTGATSESNEPASITISAGNLTGTATLSATDDDIDEDDENLTVSISSVTNGTESGTQQAVITITDNDTAGITVNQTSGSTAVTEGTGNDAFTVVLDSEPTNDVVVTASLANDEVTLSVSELTFTSENWDTPQTITVTAVDDDFDEASPHSETISFSISSLDSYYNGYSLTAVSVAITDDDSAGIVVTKAGPDNRVTEGGATDTFTVVLNTAPVDDVTITLGTTPSGQITVSPSTLTFTADDFDTAQTVTITAVNDRVKENSLVAGVTFTTSSNDTDYNSYSISTENVTVTDNDSAWITITEVDADESLTEDGDTKEYKMVLDSQPSSPVSVRITMDSEASVDVSLFSFHNESAHAKAWNKPQFFTVTAVDDADDEGDHNTIAAFTVGGPAAYDELPIPSLTIAITDNDGEEEGGSSTGGSSTGGSTTGGSTSGGDSTGGSTTGGSTTGGSTSSGSSSGSGSSTGGSTTGGSTTGGSTTGGSRPATPIYITKLSAGTDRVVRPGRTVYLYGNITKNPSGSHTWQWSQTSGQSVELTNPNGRRLAFRSPGSFQGSEIDLEFKLVATTNADQKSDTVKITVRKAVNLCLGGSCNNNNNNDDDDDNNNDFNPPAGPKCEVIGMTSDGKAICKDNNNNNNDGNDCPAGTIESMSIGGQKICNPFSKPPKITPLGTLVAVGYPFANRGRGKVVIYETQTAANRIIDPLNELIDEDPDVVVLEGSQTGDLFGHQIKVCDFNGDGQDDIYITAPNTRKGTGYLVEIYRDSGNTLSAETTGVITGGQHPLRTKFMQCLNYDGDGGDEIFLPVKLDASSSRSANNNLSFSVSGADINDDGQLVFASESEVDDSNVAESSTAFNGISDSTTSSSSLIDFSVTNPDTTIDTDVEIDAMSSGDLNGDGYEDLVLASTATCDVYVYFGQGSMDPEISTYNEIACQEGSNFTDLVIGDVTGDGIDDLVLIFPDDGGDGGSIFILPGVEGRDGDDMSIDDGYTIYGSADNPIIGVVLADTDGDGDSELVVNNGDGSNIIGGDGSVLDTGSGTGRTALGGGGVSTGCQLTQNSNEENHLIWIIVMMGILSLGLLRYGQNKKAESPKLF